MLGEGRGGDLNLIDMGFQHVHVVTPGMGKASSRTLNFALLDPFNWLEAWYAFR